MTTIDSTAGMPATAAVEARRPWRAPEMRVMRAGSAEAGPNPNVPEGQFAQGS